MEYDIVINESRHSETYDACECCGVLTSFDRVITMNGEVVYSSYEDGHMHSEEYFAYGDTMMESFLLSLQDACGEYNINLAREFETLVEYMGSDFPQTIEIFVGIINASTCFNAVYEFEYTEADSYRPEHDYNDGYDDGF